MNKSIFIIVILLQVFSLNAQVSEQEAAMADSLVSQLSQKEKISLLGGQRIFYTRGIPVKGINPVLFSDATQGVALRPVPIYKGWKLPLKKTVAFPAPILLASSWDTDLAYRYAEAIGEECRAGGIGVLLGPGFNMYRISQCGRNFEYFGEDPYLTGKLVENYVKGVQSTGTIATLKHFVANNSDYYRRKSNTIVSERALNEIYLPAFQAGVDAGAGAVMTSYNLLDGEWCGQSDYVINELLRGQLGFKGLVMTDWWSVNDGKKLLTSGQDLEMPFRKALKNVSEGIEDGSIMESDIDRMLLSQISTFIHWNTYDLEPSTLSESEMKRHEDVARETARKGIVLLKNRDHLLPIDNSFKKEILLTGPFADSKAYGTGAARVKGYDHLTMKDVLEESSFQHVTFKKNPNTEEIKAAGMILFCAGTIDGEGRDRPFELPANQEQLIMKCVQLNPNTVVLVNSGSGIRMTSWNEQAGAIVYAWYFGQNGATALLDILQGKVNPSGKLPITIEREFEDSPGYGYLPQGEELYESYNINHERKREVFDINYNEGIFVGYRWYDHKEIEPLYPFGHGLSYTDFSYMALEVKEAVYTLNDSVDVQFTLKNTGTINGAEVAQLYVSCKNSKIERAEQELKAFQKVFLKAGEECMLEFKLAVKDLAYWSEKEHNWIVEPGLYEIKIGASSRDIRQSKEIAGMNWE